MDIMSLVTFLLIGAVAGFLAGNLLRGGGFGLVGNIIVGILGAFVGGFLSPLLGIYFSGIIGSIIMATLGAVVLLLIVGVLKRV